MRQGFDIHVRARLRAKDGSLLTGRVTARVYTDLMAGGHGWPYQDWQGKSPEDALPNPGIVGDSFEALEVLGCRLVDPND